MVTGPAPLDYRAIISFPVIPRQVFSTLAIEYVIAGALKL
jgi:hypothetical protein